MGEVYRARDTTLDRDVALKVLPDAFASDLDRLACFSNCGVRFVGESSTFFLVRANLNGTFP